jgi:hypothetical protein
VARGLSGVTGDAGYRGVSEKCREHAIAVKKVKICCDQPFN